MTLLKVSFISMILLVPTARAENVRPECADWAKSVAEIINLEGATPTLVDKKIYSDVVELLKRYPEDASLNFIRINKDDDAAKQKAFVDLLKRPVCKTLTYYSLHKWLQEDSGVSGTVKAKAAKELVTRLASDGIGDSSLVTLLIRTQLLELAVDKKSLELNDVEYFELSHLITDTSKVRAQYQNKPALTGEECIKDTKKCGVKETRAVYEGLADEIKDTNTVRRELSRWAKRVSTN